jgi:hypothetical protein
VGLEWGPLSLMMIIEELFQGNSGSGLENRKLTIVGELRHPLSAKVGTNFADKRRSSVGRYSSLADSSHGV